MTEEEQNVLTGEDELGGELEQGATADDVNMFYNDQENYGTARAAKEFLDSQAGGGENPPPAVNPDDTLSDADVADINDTVHMQTGGVAGIEGQKSRDMQTLRNSHLKSEGDADPGGGYVSGTGMRLADDRSWERRYNAMQARKRMERAGLKAASMARQELLDTGKYFDDGRGNIKLKQSERKKRERFGRGWHEETEADNGAGMRYIERARQDPFGWQQAAEAQEADKAARSRAKTQAMASANKLEMELMKQRKADRVKRNAKGMLGIYDGAVSAYKLLKDAEESGDDSLLQVVDEYENEPRGFKKDAQGMVTTEMLPQKTTGNKFKYAYASKDRIKEINANLAANGIRNFVVNGISVRQKVDKDFGEVGEPMFYISGMTMDADGNKRPTGVWKSLKGLYRVGVERGKEAGIDAKDAEMNVASELGDLFGFAKRASELSAKDAAADKTKRDIAAARIRAQYNLGNARNAETARHNKATEEQSAEAEKGRNARAEAKRTADNGVGGKFDSKQFEALQAWRDRLALDEDGNPRTDLSEDDKRKIARIDARMKSMLGIADEATQDGGGGTPSAQTTSMGAATREQNMEKAKAAFAARMGGQENLTAEEAIDEKIKERREFEAKQNAEAAKVSAEKAQANAKELERRKADGRAMSSMSGAEIAAAAAGEKGASDARETLKSAPSEKTPPKYTDPLSKTKLKDLPAAILHKAGRAWGRGMKAQMESERLKQEAVNKGIEKVGEGVAKAAGSAARKVSEVANMTPEQIGGKLHKTESKNTERNAELERRDREEGRKAQEYYRGKMEEDRRRREQKLNNVFDAIDLAVSHGDRQRRSAAIEQVNEYTEELRKARADKARTESERKRLAGEEAKAKRLQKLIESGDTDKIREEAMKDTELAALIDDVFGEQD